MKLTCDVKIWQEDWGLISYSCVSWQWARNNEGSFSSVPPLLGNIVASLLSDFRHYYLTFTSESDTRSIHLSLDPGYKAKYSISYVVFVNNWPKSYLFVIKSKRVIPLLNIDKCIKFINIYFEILIFHISSYNWNICFDDESISI